MFIQLGENRIITARFIEAIELEPLGEEDKTLAVIHMASGHTFQQLWSAEDMAKNMAVYTQVNLSELDA